MTKADVLMRSGNIFAAALVIFWASIHLAEAGTFTGRFEGQGRGCWGYLWIRTKTIQWNTDWSMCYARYKVVESTLEPTPKNFEYILYKLGRRPNKICTWSYIGLYYYDYADGPGFENHWSGVGFPTLEDYQTFDERRRLTGQWSSNKHGLDNVLFCDFPVYSPPH